LTAQVEPVEQEVEDFADLEEKEDKTR